MAEEERSMGMTLDEWIEQVRRALGPDDPGVELGPDERRAILELTRVAAHTSERIAAPITAFLVGAALGDLASTPRVERIRALTLALAGRD
jgi:Domain of unknown function (DUF6457)